MTLQELEKNQKLRYWYDHITAQQASGMSIANYCKANSLAVSVFYPYKRKIKQLICDDINSSSGTIAMKQKYRRSMADAAFTGILSAITVKTDSGTGVRLVFAINRNCPDKYVVIASSDTSLSADEIVEIYSRRWQAECFYKITKGEFSLVREFHCKSMEALVSHTSIVFTRYIAIERALRKENDPRTIGNLFYVMLDENRDKEFIHVFSIFLECLEGILRSHEGDAELIITEALDSVMGLAP